MSYLSTSNHQRIYTIYKATNLVNGKVYIGFDSNWPSRIYRHKHDALLKESDWIFHRAIRLHGWNNFKWEIICQSLDGEYLLKEIESYFIINYNSFYLNGHGYNMTKGDDGQLGRVCSQITRQKMSKAKIGQTLSKQTILKILQSKREYVVSEKTKEKLSKTLRRKNHCAKNYLIIDPKDNEYNVLNLRKFCRDNLENNLCFYQKLNDVANGRLKHYKKWKCTLLN